jgi:putative endonuclease
VNTHNKGIGSKYTRTRLPVKLVYFEQFQSKSEAMKREYQLKKLTKVKKEKLVSEFGLE